METDHELLQRTYELARENNKMLHAARRNAFWGGLLKFVLYAAFLFIPLWAYMQYLSPVVNEALKTMEKVQGTNAQAQAQLSGFENALKQLQSKIPTFGQTPTQ